MHCLQCSITIVFDPPRAAAAEGAAASFLAVVVVLAFFFFGGSGSAAGGLTAALARRVELRVTLPVSAAESLSLVGFRFGAIKIGEEE